MLVNYVKMMADEYKYEAMEQRKAFVRYITNKPNHKPKHKR